MAVVVRARVLLGDVFRWERCYDAGMPRPVIGIFGSYAARPHSALYRLAHDIGHRLAAGGFTVLNGGYDGTMRAAAAGAKEAGGRTIGVTCPTVLRKRGARLKPNEFLDEVREEPTLFARIERMLRACGGYVFLPGGTGTLSELGMIWEYVHKGFIARRPIAVVGEYWLPLVDLLGKARGADDCIFRVETAEQVRDVMLRHALPTTDDVPG
ncbi:MAG TPA: LOG family protein [Phycisphaerae bacterium]|nr:LOG family protein [Phycisphaerae bacterium]HNU47011.1 LOG family protein [Phycisphaerae bacterium]